MQNLKYINYNRKSTDSEDKQILSIIAQEEAAQELAVRYGLTVMDTVNESKSAKIAGRRPGFDRMVTAIKRGKYNAILCWKLDRLARNMIEGGIIMELLQSGKIKEIRTPHRVYQQNENTILLAVEFGSANQYSRELSQNVRRGAEKRARMGLPPSTAAFGFINDKTSRNDGLRRWIPDHDRLTILREIYDKVLEGTMSAKAVYRWAMEKYNVTTVKRKRIGGKPLTVSFFYKILQNPVYAGWFEYQNMRYELDHSLPRILTEDEYYYIQKMLGRSGRVVLGKHRSPYTGFIKSPSGESIGADFKFQLICDCGHKFSYVNKDRCPRCDRLIENLKKPKYLSYVYHYNMARKRRKESTNAISEAAVHRMVLADLKAVRASENFKRWIIIKLQEKKEKDKANSDMVAKQKIATREELERKRKRLRDLLIDESITKEEYRAGVAEIEDNLAAWAAKEYQDYNSSLEIIFQALSAADIFDSTDEHSFERKRLTLRKMRSNIIWDEKTLCIHWPDWLPALADAFREAKYINPMFEPENTLADKDQTGVFASVSPILLKRLELIRTLLDTGEP